MAGDPDGPWMRAALALARRGLGQTASNPTVGCILVKDGRVVARGWTQPGGRPHAEQMALALAGQAARGATAYVTLEPCAHHGQTPPCCDALIAAGVARVVAALPDPDSRVNGRGLARLAAAGVVVRSPFLAEPSAALNAGFFSRVRDGRPCVTWKAATTLDGRIAAANGTSRWITGPAARARGHLLRATHDAILIGAGTARADNPVLTCRLPGLEHRSPLPVVVETASADPAHFLPDDLRLWQAPALVVVPDRDGLPDRHGQRRWGSAVTVLPVAAGADGRAEPAGILAALADRGINHLLLEGGGRLAATFWQAGCIDRIVWFRAPAVMGGDGLPVLAAIGVTDPAALARLTRLSCDPVGDDLVETYRVHA